MRSYVFADRKWSEVSEENQQKLARQHQSAWTAFKSRTAGRHDVRLRDLSMLLNQCIHPAAYKFALDSYRQYVHFTFGSEPDPSKLARTPLFTAYNAPPLQASSMPSCACFQVNQCYLHDHWFQSEDRQRKLLVCTTSRTHTLSMPLQVFHAYACQHFDGVAYIFDPTKDHYKSLRQDTIDCVESLLAFVRPSSVGFLGTSAGACMAIDLCLTVRQGRAVAGSPVLDNAPNIKTFVEESPIATLADLIRITYGDNPIDSYHEDLFARLNGGPELQIAYNMSAINPTHASFGVTTLNGMIDDLLGWLAASPLNGHSL